MSGINAIGGSGNAFSVNRVMQLRAEILARNEALSRAGAAGPATAPAPTRPTSFADTLQGALNDVNEGQNRAAQLSEAYERGQEVDIAKVMLARQQASVGFEATLQVRNKILAAYKDIMSMPV